MLTIYFLLRLQTVSIAAKRIAIGFGAIHKLSTETSLKVYCYEVSCKKKFVYFSFLVSNGLRQHLQEQIRF
jgi:hypothetical protein